MHVIEIIDFIYFHTKMFSKTHIYLSKTDDVSDIINTHTHKHACDIRARAHARTHRRNITKYLVM